MQISEIPTPYLAASVEDKGKGCGLRRTGCLDGGSVDGQGERQTKNKPYLYFHMLPDLTWRRCMLKLISVLLNNNYN
jgi:hypothetical protein